MPKKKKEGTSWGLIFSIMLHGTIVLLVLLWGINKYTATDINQPINVSLSSLEYKGSSDKPGDKVKSKKEDIPEKVQEVKKEEKAEEPEVKEEPKKEVVEEKKEEKEKKEIVEKEEPKKEEPKKEEPDKKIVALETKKEEPRKEVKKEPKKEPKKEVKKKKAKPKEKKDETKVARNNVINELKRKNVIDSLSKDEKLSEVKGNENSDGLKGSDKEDVAGTTGKINKALLNVYNNAIWRKIKPKFRIPPNIPTDGSLVTNIFFKIDRKGNVSGVKVAKSSGNPAFDNFCINTIISSSPLPAPPTDIAKLVINEGFEIPLSNNEG